MYYIVFFILVLFSFLEISGRLPNKTAFRICYLLMSAMAIFRYGQLTDYFNYEINYENPEAIMRDPLFAYLMFFCKDVGMAYETFSMVMDCLIMGLAYPFFSKTCHKSAIPLLFYYCYIFLLFPMSGIRQGLCISLVFFGFTYLLENRKVLFFLMIVVGGFLHFSLFSVALIVLLYDKKNYNKDYWWIIIISLTLFALVTPDLSSYLPEFLEGKSLGEYQESRWPQMVLRFLIIVPVLCVKPQYGTMGYYAKAICIIGYCLYCTLSFSIYMAGRLEFYFRIFIGLFAASIIVSEIKVRRSFSRIALTMLVLIHVVLFYKNIDALIVQGGYKQNVNMFNFPYVSIFDKEELATYKL